MREKKQQGVKKKHLGRLNKEDDREQKNTMRGSKKTGEVDGKGGSKSAVEG